MKDHPDKVDVLVVDDRLDKLLTLEAMLEPLGENIVAVSSGREALRCILRQSFAVILLDINMPGMDGFETAELIRQYRGSRHTPIIFMTVAGDDLHMGRSYALGAVDYILTPIDAEVLRSKVRVFADLFRKTAEVERQAAALARQAARLRRLNASSLKINSELSLENILRAVTDAARDIVDAHQATTTMVSPSGPARGVVSFSDAFAAFRGHPPDRDAEALYALACPAGGPLRLTRREIEARPDLRAASEAGSGPPRRGLLAVPLTERNGRVVGLIQVSDSAAGDFTDDDLSILVQLAQLGSTAVQNCLHAEAREANRLKDEFLATLSHELRTPLHALLGWTHILRSGSPDPARIARGLEVIERNAQVQSRLIEELLDVSRITSGKLLIDNRPIALVPLVEGALETLRPAAEAKGIQLRSALDEDAGRILGDAERLQQIVSNLVGNALKFTPSGGSVDVRLGRDGGDVVLRVADTGVGIAPEFLPFVFERFRQADSSITRAQGGLGLGLSVVLHLVELHGGSVRAESPGVGRGATFIVRFPALALLERASAPGVDLEPAPHSGVQTLDGLRVLVVDDDDDARELLKEVLCQHRAEVTTASSAREALELLEALVPHVLVSDVAMQDEDGYDLIRRVRKRTQSGGAVPALALTAYARKEDRQRALDAGFQMHASKPIEPTELIAAVASLARSATSLQETR